MRWLSKSQINTFRQCPNKWKLIYIDKLEGVPSRQMIRGKKIHKEIEEFYKNIELQGIGKGIPKIVPKKNMSNIRKFVEFEQKRIKECVNRRKEFELRYFKPIAQELKIESEELKLRGIIDAIYMNPKDGGIIIIDWKSGKYRPYNISEYRFELAIYKELLEKSGKVGGKIKYWGIFFVDAGKLFFERINDKFIKNMYKKVEKVRADIEKKEYPCKMGVLCRWCEFQDVCEAWKGAV